MKKIAFLTQKGGTGKSMLATLLALVAAEAGKVLIVDCDRQRSIWNWQQRCKANGTRNGSIDVVATEDPKLLARILTSGEFEDRIILIDTKGALESLAMVAAEFSDLVILPTKPDLASLLPTAEFYADMRRREIQTPARVVLNEVHPFHRNSNSHQLALKTIEDLQLQRFATAIFWRDVYREIASGVGSFEQVKMGDEAVGKAKANIKALVAEMLAFMAGQHHG